MKFVKNKCSCVAGSDDSTTGSYTIKTEEFNSSRKKRLGLFLIGAEDFIITDTYEEVLYNSYLLLSSYRVAS